MNDRRSNLSLWFGLAVSVLVHVFVLLPVFARVLTEPGEIVALQAQFRHRDLEQRDDPYQPPDDLQLGIDEGSPSTLTWIGYEQYEEHLAQLSEVEQAAFTDDPVASPTPPTPQPPTDVAMNEPSKSAQPAAPDPQMSTAPTDASADAAERNASPAEDAPQPADAMARVNAQPSSEPSRIDAPVNEDVEPTPVSTANARSIPDALLALAERLRLYAEAAGAQGEDDSMRGAAGTKSTPAGETGEAPKQAAQQPGQSAPSSSAAPADPAAEHANMDSVASSTVDVPLDELRPGKPLAARGLTLRPQRPEFVTLTLMTSAPGNPLVEIGFTHAGKPLIARILESSGDERIDGAIEASLYRWRAEGEPLSELTGKQTLNVQIRIILNPRR